MAESQLYVVYGIFIECAGTAQQFFTGLLAWAKTSQSPLLGGGSAILQSKRELTTNTKEKRTPKNPPKTHPKQFLKGPPSGVGDWVFSESLIAIGPGPTAANVFGLIMDGDSFVPHTVEATFMNNT